MPATVAIVKCADYDRARVREAVAQAFGLIPELERLIPPPGGKVLLKPNLLSANDPPEAAINTHPEFVRAVAEFFIARGCKVYIGDSCGSLAAGSTAKAIQMTGLDRVAAETGAELVDFDRAPSVKLQVPEHRVLSTVKVPHLLREVKLFVTLPKLKTHGLTSLTGAVKNQLGLVPGKGKKDVHVDAPKPAQMAQALLDIHSVARPHLAIMDAITGMEGNGPAAGNPRHVGLVLASNDCVALDAIAGALIGLAPQDVDTTRLAQERGLGVGRLEEIELLGATLNEVAIKDFKKPPQVVRSALMDLIPAWFMRWMFNTVGSTYAVVLDDRCIVCGECVANCPVGAIRKVGDKALIDPAACISCYCCSEVCQHRAIRMQRPFAGRVIRGLLHLATGRRDRAAG